jgi:hypothetical protein
MRDDRDYKVEISSLGGFAASGQGSAPRRAYLSILFACCNVYQRVYVNAAGDRYAGRCPRCGGLVQFRVGSGGTSQRMFIAR